LAQNNPTKIVDILIDSFATSICGYRDLKLQLLLVLFGGTKKILKNMELRSDIHLLMCGDPGIAKSQFMKVVRNIAMRSTSATGRGTTEAGLLGAVLGSGHNRHIGNF
jgi:DNA replicative helicase MCM subunit Mcm2 (Cdc46/Mcm family)